MFDRYSRFARTHPTRFLRAGRRRGVVLIIVLAILALLTLVGTTLAISSRLEIRAARNFALSIQANMSAVTGVTSALAALGALEPAVAHNQPWARPQQSRGNGLTGVEQEAGATQPRNSQSGGAARSRQQLEVYDASATFRNTQSDIRMNDASGKININAAGRVSRSDSDNSGVLAGAGDLDLAAALAAMLRARGLDATPAESLAQAIVEYRHGADGQPGGVSGLDSAADAGETAEFVGDLGSLPEGDDRPYQCLEDLLKVPGMTPQIFAAIRPFVTVFSCSADMVPPAADPDHRAATPQEQSSGSDAADASGPYFASGLSDRTAKLALNTATATKLEAHLRRFFPSWDVALARQFAANIADARDADRAPTRMPDIGGEPVLGVEIAPCINEVWPDSITDTADGDHGQYVELHNPYGETISLAGWRLVVGGARIALSGAMAPGSYLIVTDDYNGARDSADEHRPGYGSFYDIFGLVPSGELRRLIEDRALNLPDGQGEVRLLDAAGALIDFFAYSGGQFDGTRKSFQRDDPRVRASAKLLATPFARNLNCRPPADALAPNLLAAAQRDRDFVAVGDILGVFAGHVASGGAARPWLWPALKSAAGDAPDIRLLDVFCLSGPDMSESALADDDAGGQDIAAAKAAERLVHGRLNVNTASPEALAAVSVELSGGAAFGAKVAARREELALQLVEQREAAAAPFERLSDLYLDDAVFGGLTDAERIEIARRTSGALTTESCAFEVWSKGQAVDGAGKGSTRLTRGVWAAICRTDQSRRVVLWQYAYTK